MDKVGLKKTQPVNTHYYLYVRPLNYLGGVIHTLNYSNFII